MEITKRFTTGCIAKLRESIEEAHFQEVLAVGKLSKDSIVDSIIIAARGSDSQVPALMPYMEKGDVVIHNHPGGDLRPSTADLAVASRLGNQGIGFYIIDNDAEELFVVAEPLKTAEKHYLNPEKLASLIEDGGKLSTVFKDFEPRESQISMLKKVSESFNSNTICVAEAGTGVGKSLAYLLPAFSWVSGNDERAVITTATINLQQQLTSKDIPLAQDLLGKKVKYTLVKGRGNYLCLKRLEEALEENSLFEEENSQLMVIKEWSKNSSTGSRSELPFIPDDGTWLRICSEADSCLGIRCLYREACFLLKMRKEAASSKILITNHHLLFSDLSLRLAGTGYDATAVLPPFSHIVFDEAHNIESCATSFFSQEISKNVLERQLNRLFRVKRRRSIGLVPALQKILGITEGLKSIPVFITDLIKKADKLNADAADFLGTAFNFRFMHTEENSGGEVLLKDLKDIHIVLLDCIETIQEVLDRIEGEDLENPSVIETGLVLRRLEVLASVCEKFSRIEERPEDIFWMEKRRTQYIEDYRFIITPLDIAPLMREAVFDQYESVICTSATLTVNNQFDFWKSRVGLKDYDSRETGFFIFPSPFPYEKHVLLGVPEDAPLPQEESYLHYITQFIGDALELSEGKGLVLFTSYEMLRQTFDAVKPRLSEKSIPVFKQGDEERSRLLKRYTTDLGSVLFATDSFWQGIDVPGDALQIVIICRLPFRVPTDPVHKARLEAIQKRGGNPFIHLSLPEAVMRLKQGFGRLMRRTTDKGIVIILDSRVIKKNYGKAFLQSLPETRTSIKSTDELMIDMENFLYP